MGLNFRFAGVQLFPVMVHSTLS